MSTYTGQSPALAWPYVTICHHIPDLSEIIIPAHMSGRVGVRPTIYPAQKFDDVLMKRNVPLREEGSGFILITTKLRITPLCALFMFS